MSIEQTLERIALALETIASSKYPTVGTSSTVSVPTVTVEVPAKQKKTKEQKVENPVAPTITKETLADALRKLVLKGPEGPEIAKSILVKFGAARLSEIKEADYPACYEQLTKAS